MFWPGPVDIEWRWRFSCHAALHLPINAQQDDTFIKRFCRYAVYNELILRHARRKERRSKRRRRRRRKRSKGSQSGSGNCLDANGAWRKMEGIGGGPIGQSDKSGPMFATDSDCYEVDQELSARASHRENEKEEKDERGREEAGARRRRGWRE